MDDLSSIFNIIGGGGVGAIGWLLFLLRKDLGHTNSNVQSIADRQAKSESRLHDIINGFNSKLDNILSSVNKRIYYEDGKPIYQRCEDCEKLMNSHSRDIDELAQKAGRAETEARLAAAAVAALRRELKI